MSVYLGNNGCVQLRRTGNPVGFTLEPDDVDAPARRMSVEFDGPCPFFTGDQLEIIRVDSTADLQLISGMSERDVTKWVHVDAMGGMRLFSTLDAALSGKVADAVELVTPSEEQQITIDVSNLNYSCVGQVKSYELTTERETIDISLLGDEYRSRYDQGLISGQGQIEAIWDQRASLCDDMQVDASNEMPHYFAQLVIRFKEGADFKGIFYIYKDEAEVSSVWYEADCIVTNVGMSFVPTDVISTTIQFVTTGPIALRMGSLPGYLLQENSTPTDENLFLLEQPPGFIEIEEVIE